MSTELTGSGLWLEIKDKDLPKGLRACKLKTQLVNIQSVPKEKEKLSVLGVKKNILEKTKSCILSRWVGPRW